MLQPPLAKHLFPQKKIVLVVKWQQGQHSDSASNPKEDSQQGTMGMGKTSLFLLLQIGILYYFLFKDTNSFPKPERQSQKIRL
jgi:hypothetical protein